MQDLIFIIILAVFIGGMLWSDRDNVKCARLEAMAYMYGIARKPSENNKQLKHRMIMQIAHYNYSVDRAISTIFNMQESEKS